jgi:hypothetical protein
MQTLERLHSELGGPILENKEETQRLAGQMLHVEAVIKMLDPTYNLRRIAVKRRKSNPWFKRGTVYRRAVDVLRTATEPLTAREIAERVLAARQYNWLAIEQAGPGEGLPGSLTCRNSILPSRDRSARLVNFPMRRLLGNLV